MAYCSSEALPRSRGVTHINNNRKIRPMRVMFKVAVCSGCSSKPAAKADPRGGTADPGDWNCGFGETARTRFQMIQSWMEDYAWSNLQRSFSVLS
ncbi:serine palmitoyltransferase small subunit B isoform X2 [Hemiscyllium ocellatum]|uniref:serine palmitoyltransferase small subunit B isoform X2 n=1 Tax=Hemiscyllium ocellatum TaxID=170820 RepID=UPI0029674CC5|nr:serine palmitoyltransferase small subunit B isoform X2 [Hemiscyllium ocellatum]